MKIKEIKFKINDEIFFVNCKTELEDMVGNYEVNDNGGFVFVDGPFLKEYKKERGKIKVLSVEALDDDNDDEFFISEEIISLLAEIQKEQFKLWGIGPQHRGEGFVLDTSECVCYKIHEILVRINEWHNEIKEEKELVLFIPGLFW